MIDKLQFISSESNGITHIESIQNALDAGCKWIQLRIKNQSPEVILQIACEAENLCRRYQAKLIINDYASVAKAVNAYGLHLGLNDMPIAAARKITGNNMLIGGTANTSDDILNRIKEGADYVGLGPFRFTSTKQNLSPVLGLEGYKSRMEMLRQLGCSVPVIAIGGITAEDIPEILETGIYGVAMSGAIQFAENKKDLISTINNLLC
ncbi:thiamine phosphate synthase [Dyadobacter sediminis]|uniref:Thiamine-phosphate synthase n=1 Tax=Dyadobacter sediminis TaxID=1493691 RepID=A0A5R9KBV6_9BACT|nr:thiamine phosphate synthase [Dyadobacter sediminis]TLU92301.1 thiamine phosphate synthase [Dyadobacter sediminis]GGB95633.1 thiamine-phosphate synthase [Dyadobacter sediminis]